MISGPGIWVVRQEAEGLGRYLETKLEGHLGGLKDDGGESNRAAFTSRYASCHQWVLVMTTGIAVRYLAELIKDKKTDPGVVVIDEGCRFAVSLLGGHEGGANRLAYRVANLTGAVPVVTTATEVRKSLVLGLGCRKNIPAALIDAAVQQALKMVVRTLEDVREIATIDLKGQEPGLLEWLLDRGAPPPPAFFDCCCTWKISPSFWAMSVAPVCFRLMIQTFSPAPG